MNNKTFANSETKKNLEAAFAGADVVFHNASMVHTKHNRESDVWEINLGGTESVLTAHLEAVGGAVTRSTASR